ncbi:MAG: type II toxin-antitoxin system VapC family toxin [Tepidisphaeraceae bacterium]|jgi:tRNA(fMet)-specific endonuclease VapC
MVILDTDHLSLLDRGDVVMGKSLRRRLASFTPDEVATTIITYEEQMRGWMAYLAGAKRISQQVEAYRRLGAHLHSYRDIRVLEFSERAATEFQRLRGACPRVGAMDLKIASIALVYSATLLTRNIGDFSQVPGLRLEDWSA